MNSVDNKKKALTLQREKLLRELNYFERQIEDAKLTELNQIKYEESSDSDSELSIPLDIEPSIPNLKIEYSTLQTCLDATQELTGLQVLQSEVNILVGDPKFDGELPVTEEGVWREVTVECRVDLVPFSMTFFVHQPNRRFGPLSYRGLSVTALKKPHEAELNNSILHELTRPSDAFEVLKAYSSAHRSRRCTLAQLAATHSAVLRMAPLPEGGYQLKCGDLLQISWMLQNTSSPVAPFHHRMKFDLEYVDEAHIHTIKEAHKALSDPTIDTDERTGLLSKIINVCLEVQGLNLPESTASESETATQKGDQPTKRKREDSEAMAPPKAPPKKSRPKGKENKGENRNGGSGKGDRDAGIGGSGVNNAGGERAGERTGAAAGAGEQMARKPKDIDDERIKKVSEPKIDGHNSAADVVHSKVKDKHAQKKTEQVTDGRSDRRPAGTIKRSGHDKQDPKSDNDRVVKENVEHTKGFKTTNQPSLNKDHKPKKNHAEDKLKQQVASSMNKNSNKETQKSKKNAELNRDNTERPKTIGPSKAVGKKSSGPAGFKDKSLKTKQLSHRRSNVVNGAILKNTRIPQMAPNSVQKIVKKNLLRSSPRMSASKFAGISQSIRRPHTHIPRLVSKPLAKS
ncbi:unnamed protein product, partial [Iphiclides podalirius]